MFYQNVLTKKKLSSVSLNIFYTMSYILSISVLCLTSWEKKGDGQNYPDFFTTGLFRTFNMLISPVNPQERKTICKISKIWLATEFSLRSQGTGLRSACRWRPRRGPGQFWEERRGGYWGAAHCSGTRRHLRPRCPFVPERSSTDMSEPLGSNRCFELVSHSWPISWCKWFFQT